MTRTALSNTGDWKLKHREQDIRGWPVHDASGRTVGEVDHLIVDTNQRRVSSIVLDNGRDFSARDIRLGDDVVYLERPASATVAETVRTYDDGTEVERREQLGRPSFDEHRDEFRRHHRTAFADRGGAYEETEAAYRYGYEQAHTETHRNRPYQDAQSDLQRDFGERHRDRDWNRDREAVRYGYSWAQRGRANTSPSGREISPQAARTGNERPSDVRSGTAGTSGTGTDRVGAPRTGSDGGDRTGGARTGTERSGTERPGSAGTDRRGGDRKQVGRNELPTA